ncbi:ABC transporter permease [Nonomuraea roseoviolacea]|uniref:ABC-2 type transport system permease protein n=1 Tax=Nonomuraea roseoviolacea subsp. carminata TaxID=160689 RepID=A0ABT1K4P4_9ACTN|nr:ABC transporter permease [Nonomuraea roseoviolacea]MCP2348976.1 ABC-2 type transport system permease protein [Nonomuraea roseoviolacea subsp. carminata]
MLRALWTVSALELRTRLRDGTAIVIAVIVPVTLATLFGLALGGDDPPLKATVGFVDLDGGEFPASVRREVMAAKELKGSVTLRDLPSREQAGRELESGAIGSAIVFPAGFSKSVGAGKGGDVAVLKTPESPLAGVVASAIVDRISAVVDARTLAVRAVLRAGVPGDQVKELVERNGAAGPAIGLADDPLAGGKIDLSVYYGSGMAALFAFFVVGASFRGLLTERKLGTLDRIRAAPVAAWVPVAGKAAVGFALAVAGALLNWGASVLIFGSTWGDPAAVTVVLVAHVLAAAALTMLVTSRVRTDAQADGVIMIVSFVAAFFGGSLVPIYNLPGPLQAVALLTPNGWTSKALTELAGSGAGLAAVALPVGVLCAIALTAGGLALLGFRKGLLL